MTDPCLHCAIMETMNDWFRDHGKREDGKIVFDVLMAVSKLSECVVEVTEMPPDRSQRRRAFRFAHDGLDAALKASRTGTQVAVEIPSEN